MVRTEQVATLDELYVEPGHRNGGIGSKMIELLVATSKSRGVDVIEINVDEGDGDAQRFYERHGFASTDGEPSITTRKWVDVAAARAEVDNWWTTERLSRAVTAGKVASPRSPVTWKLYVHPDHRGRGIGPKPLDAVKVNCAPARHARRSNTSKSTGLQGSSTSGRDSVGCGSIATRAPVAWCPHHLCAST